MNDTSSRKVERRKRRRKEEEEEAVVIVKEEEEEVKEEVETLSPHTQRLIQLIVGSSSKEYDEEDVIETAIGLLSRIACSPGTSDYQLWDILGQLQRAILINFDDNNEDNNSSNALASSQAMKCILRSCSSRDDATLDLFSFPTTTDNTTTTTTSSSSYQWLQLQDLLPQLSMVLNEGTVVLQSKSTRQEEEEDEKWLHQLDTSKDDPTKDDDDGGDFCHRRMELQRTLLAKRLGFLPENDDSHDFLTQQDFQSYHNSSSSTPKTKKKKKQSKQEKSRLEEVLLWQVQQSSSSSSSSGRKKQNKKTQWLLVTEFIYRMLDPNWQVRYGAMLGILAFLQVSSSSSSSNSCIHKGKEDVLCRAIVVLACEQFGDYSGSLITSKKATTTTTMMMMKGSCVIVPVQEMAAQIIAYVYTQLSTTFQTYTWSILQYLLSYPQPQQWYVRHGALMVLKYLAAYYTTNTTKQLPPLQSSNHDERSAIILLQITQMALNAFQDSSFDVIAVAAQIVSTVLSSSSSPQISNVEIPQILFQSSQFWKLVKSLELDSPCCVDVIQTCSLLLQKQPPPPPPPPQQQQYQHSSTHIHDWLLPKLFQFLSTHNVPSVHISCYQALTCILPSLLQPTTTTTTTLSTTTTTTRTNGCNNSNNIHATLCHLLQHMFQDYWKSSNTTTPFSEHTQTNKKPRKNDEYYNLQMIQSLQTARNKTWNTMVHVISKIIQQQQQQQQQQPSSKKDDAWNLLYSKTTHGLLIQYITHMDSKTKNAMQQNKTTNKVLSCCGGLLEEKLPVQYSQTMEASKALAQFLQLCNNDVMMILSIITIQCMLQSPWPIDREKSCLFLSSLLTNHHNLTMTKKNNIPSSSSLSSLLWNQRIQNECQPLLEQFIYNHNNNNNQTRTQFCENTDNAIRFQQMTLCHEALATSLERFLLQTQSKTLSNHAAAADDDDDASWRDVIDSHVQEVLKIWDTIVPKKKKKNPQIITTKITNNNNHPSLFYPARTSMRLLASFSSCLILSLQNCNIPTNDDENEQQQQQQQKPLTPIIRSIMTSLKNETCDVRSERTIQSLVLLLQLLSKDEDRQNVCLKIIDSLSAMACMDMDTIQQQQQQQQQQQSLPKGFTHIGCQRSQRAIQILVKNLHLCHNQNTIITPIWKRLQPLTSLDPAASGEDLLLQALSLLSTLSNAFVVSSKNNANDNTNVIMEMVTNHLLPITTLVACASTKLVNRKKAMISITNICRVSPLKAVPQILPMLFKYLRRIHDDSGRLGACTLFHAFVIDLGVSICPFVRYLLPLAMSMMTDPISDCATLAASTFASLVRIAPLVPTSSSSAGDEQLLLDDQTQTLMKDCCPTDSSDRVIDHLIHGQPLPPYQLPKEIDNALKTSGVTLRDYQKEGVAWIQFLQSVKLNGALCDDMGLGKTLQSLIGVAIAHHSSSSSGKSLVVCPSTLVGHWVKEIQKFFSNSCLKPMSYDGNAKQRKQKWNDKKTMKHCNIIVTSYPVLRNDISILKETNWIYCILDEGHLLKNPKTATAKSARMLKSEYRMILTGTPVQNKVHELWAVFDFLMPNYLGSESDFSQNYAKWIVKGQLPGASTDSIRESANKLKLLHQQVLPFILRREKGQVMKELPPKTITDIPCEMSDQQIKLYQEFCSGSEAKRALDHLHKILQRQHQNINSYNGKTGIVNEEQTGESLSQEVLRSLFYLRLLCTHPILISNARNRGTHQKEAKKNDSKSFTYFNTKDNDLSRLDCSGKLLALNDLMRSAGIFHDELTAADNDESALYIEDFGKRCSTNDDHLMDESNNDNILNWIDPCDYKSSERTTSSSKCLIFAQFTQSLDVVEKFLFAPHMSSLKYLRLDGRVPAEARSSIVDRFNNDKTIKCMLLTTKVGGLGLNLTGADTVIFLEHDWNPHTDLQAMDRAHRIGQTKTVHVYRLITSGSVEEKVMELQQMKMSMSQAIVNSDNSTMYSMGTDRLLDLFTFENKSKNDKAGENNNKNFTMDDLWCEDEYSQLSVSEFLNGFFPIPNPTNVKT